MKKGLVEPNLWKDRQNHYLNVLESDWYRLLIKLQNIVTKETIKFYDNEGLITMHLPVTTGSISSPMGRGSDSTPVKVNLCGTDTYLADSMQFMLEYGCRLHEKGVYYIMPSFRGELPDERHLCQFFHSEAEIIGDLEDIINISTKYVKYLSQKIIEQLGNEIEETIGNIDHIEKIAYKKESFPRITFNEVENIFIEAYPDTLNEYIEYNDGFRNITRKAEKELIRRFNGVVWITNYDELAVPFYQQLDVNIKGTTKNADLLMGIGETIGCGERHGNKEDILAALKKHQVNPEEYKWYIALKEKYPLITSGFGMGIERYLMWVMKCEDIRNMQILLRFNGENNLP